MEQEIYLGEVIFDGQRGPVYTVSTEAPDKPYPNERLAVTSTRGKSRMR